MPEKNFNFKTKFLYTTILIIYVIFKRNKNHFFKLFLFFTETNQKINLKRPAKFNLNLKVIIMK